MIDEIRRFFARKPRFNIAVIKVDKDVKAENLASLLGFQLLDIQREILEDRVKVEDVRGYTDLVKLIKDHLPSADGVVIKNVDILLATLGKEKRKAFFEKLLQTSYVSPTVLIVKVFKEDVPQITQLYNYGLVLDGGWENGI